MIRNDTMHLLLALLLFALFADHKTLTAQAPTQRDRIPHLESNGTQWVRITHPVLNASWLIELPEDVETEDAFYLIWENIRVDWKEYGNQEIGYDWEATREWIQRAQQKIDMRGFSIRPGMRVSVRMRPSSERVDILIKLTNLTGSTLRPVFSSGGCLEHRTERFIDNDASRTFIKTARGLVRLSDIDRSEKIRSLYLFAPHWYDTRVFRAWEYFWGRSVARPSSGFIASIAADGKGAIGIGFDHSFGIMQNSDNHHCMHSCPYFGTLPPGQTVERHGVILFGETVEGLFQLFDGLGFRPDSTSPSN